MATQFLVFDIFAQTDGQGLTQGLVFVDTTSFSEATGYSFGNNFVLTDTLSLSDQLYIGFILLFSDRLNLLDNQQTNSYWLVDSLFLQDFIFVTLNINFRDIPDTLNFIDFFKLTAPFITASSDSLTLSDTTGNSSTSQPMDSFSLSDTVGLSLLSVFSVQTESVSDSFQLMDSVQLSNGTQVMLGDFLIFADIAGSASVNVLPTTNAYLRQYLNDNQ